MTNLDGRGANSPYFAEAILGRVVMNTVKQALAVSTPPLVGSSLSDLFGNLVQRNDLLFGDEKFA